jgi:hypothetical protein
MVHRMAMSAEFDMRNVSRLPPDLQPDARGKARWVKCSYSVQRVPIVPNMREA